MQCTVPTQLPVLLRSIAWKPPQRPQLRLSWTRPEDVPTVDIIITCCGEDIDVLLDTVRAACNLDYPKDRFRVFLSDDAKSDALKAAVAALDITGPHLIYTAREKPPIKDYKAGNLNHGLRISKEMTNLAWQNRWPYPEEAFKFDFPSKESSAATLVGIGSDSDEISKPIATPLTPTMLEWDEVPASNNSSQYIVGIDADMIPERHLIRALLPHLITDNKMAMACPPQVRLPRSSL